ncbi:MAG: hypothetical protein ACI9BW_002754, partial [Gammaproteobacteria bacterium]
PRAAAKFYGVLHRLIFRSVLDFDVRTTRTACPICDGVLWTNCVILVN